MHKYVSNQLYHILGWQLINIFLHCGCHSRSLCLPFLPSDGGKLCVHPEEPVIPSGCRDVPKPAGGLRGAGWSVMWHWWKGRRKFRMLGQEEEEKEGTWPGEIDVTSSCAWAFIEVGFIETDDIIISPKSKQKRMHCPLVVGCRNNHITSSSFRRKSKGTWNSFNLVALINLGSPVLAPSAVTSSQIFNLLLFLLVFFSIFNLSCRLW